MNETAILAVGLVALLVWTVVYEQYLSPPLWARTDTWPGILRGLAAISLLVLWFAGVVVSVTATFFAAELPGQALVRIGRALGGT